MDITLNESLEKPVKFWLVIFLLSADYLLITTKDQQHEIKMSKCEFNSAIKQILDLGQEKKKCLAYPRAF